MQTITLGYFSFDFNIPVASKVYITRLHFPTSVCCSVSEQHTMTDIFDRHIDKDDIMIWYDKNVSIKIYRHNLASRKRIFTNEFVTLLTFPCDVNFINTLLLF